MNILHVCPANCATGGPEAIHWLVSGLNKIEGVDARIWYWDVKSDPPMPEEYKTYGCEYVTDLPEGYDGTIIYPEIWANHALDHPECTNAVWWLGLDAYAGWTPEEERGAFLKDDSIIHIVQSEYANDLLNQLGVKNIVKCTDIVNNEFYADYEEEERSDVVLYNPAKATPFMHRLMAECSDIEFKPITGMTRDQVVDAMRHAKLYVDFGEFPGRERMPREAALCGCCLITSKIGSAAYEEDFTHSYKFESKDSHIWAIAHKIRYVLKNYTECREDFEAFRQALRSDKYLAAAGQRKVANEIQYHNSCLQRSKPHPQCLGFRSSPDV